MRGFGVSLCVLLLVGCGAGGGSSNNVPPPVPTSAVNGAAVDGLIANGTIRIYDFNAGSKGALLAETETDDVGLYSLNLQAETGSILIELTGGSYKEEATGKTVRLNIDESEKLTALANHEAGEPVTIAVTAYTHVAAALARHLISTGESVEEAIHTANHRITQWVGLPIIETIPLDITISSNISASVTPAHFYGFLSGAISLWTKEHYANPSDVITNGCEQYNVCSIDFIQTMYADTLADGMLDGLGAGGTPLSFGATALSPSIYRAELAMAILDITDTVLPSNINNELVNKTGLTGTQLLLRARAYAASTDSIFAGVPPQSIDTPVISLDSHANGAWVRASPNVTGTVVDQIGPGFVTLTVDGITTGSLAANYYAPSISWDTTAISEGIHTIALNVNNGAGLTATASANVTVDNTKPTVVFTSVAEGTKCRITGTIADWPGVAINSVTISPKTYTQTSSVVRIYYGNYLVYGSQTAAYIANQKWTVLTSPDYEQTIVNNYASFLVNTGPQTITVSDKAGNRTILLTGGEHAGSSTIAAGCHTGDTCNTTIYGAYPICSAPVVQ